MMHIFEYLKLISYCVVPFVIVIVLNLCIIFRLRQSAPTLRQCEESLSLSSSTVTTPRRSVSNRSRRYFFAKTSTTSARSVPQNVVDESVSADLLPLGNSPRSPSYVRLLYCWGKLEMDMTSYYFILQNTEIWENYFNWDRCVWWQYQTVRDPRVVTRWKCLPAVPSSHDNGGWPGCCCLSPSLGWSSRRRLHFTLSPS